MSEEYIRPEVRTFLESLAASPGPHISDLDAPAARMMSLKMRTFADIDSRPIAFRQDLSIPAEDGRSIGARFYDSRAERDKGPLIVYLHGGGFVVGDLDSYDAACADIAAMLDLPVISIDYRLAPEHRWPSAPDDCEVATRWITEQADIFGRSFDSLVLAGDSAGGTLAIVTAMALRDEAAALPVIAIWPIYPAVDLRRRYPSTERLGQGYLLTTDSLRWFNEAYDPDFTHWRTSPRLGSQLDMPPALIVTASLDPLLDQGRDYAVACIEAGVPVIYREAKGTLHGWLTMRKAIPSGNADLQGCITALRTIIEEYRP